MPPASFHGPKLTPFEADVAEPTAPEVPRELPHRPPAAPKHTRANRIIDVSVAVQSPIAMGTVYILHLFSGRRRSRDLQHEIERAVAAISHSVAVLSLDLAIDQRCDLSVHENRSFWRNVGSSGKVAGAVGGPP